MNQRRLLCMPIHLFKFLLVYRSIYSFCLTSQSVCLYFICFRDFVCLSLSICVSAYLSAFLTLCPSVCVSLSSFSSLTFYPLLFLNSSPTHSILLFLSLNTDYDVYENYSACKPLHAYFFFFLFIIPKASRKIGYVSVSDRLLFRNKLSPACKFESIV